MKSISDLGEIQDMARGAAFLGSGGGGDPYLGELYLREQLNLGNVPQLAGVEELADEAFVASLCGIGASTVLVEHLISKTTLTRLVALAQKFYGRRIDALISAEIGGCNSIIPLALGAELGIPVVDADGMGRAFPRLEMTSFGAFGCPASPCILMDDSGNVITVEAASDRLTEELCRPVTAALGAMTFGMLYPMSGAQIKRTAIRGTLTQTIEIGRTIRLAREGTQDACRALVEHLHRPQASRYAYELFDGKIADVLHDTRDGWHFGRAVIVSPSNPDEQLVVEFQNEYLAARRNGRTVTIVPDLIGILDRDSAEPLPAYALAYGQRVRVVGYSADPLMRHPKCLAVFGPRNFGIDEDFVPLETLNAGGPRGAG